MPNDQQSKGYTGSPPAAAPALVSQPELLKQKEKCLELLRQIRDANLRIIHRGRSGSGPWSRILNDTYGHVCDTCHRRRLGTEPPDPYFDVICVDPDVDSVCVKKWLLGEALDDYRNRLNRLSPLPLDHDELELLIRRSVTQPNWSPLELEVPVSRAIEAVEARGAGVILNAKESVAGAPTAKALLLFLHGLGGRAEATWGRLPEFLMAERKIAERFAVGFYSFPTSLFRWPFSARAPKVQELAAGLRTQIDHEEFERVELVCHSLGGLIARWYLIEEVKAVRPLRVERLALFAVPNNGAGLASVGQFVSWRHNQIKQLCCDADLIEFLNDDWFRFGLQSKVRTKFIVGTQDRVVDRFSVAGYWGNPDVETVVGRGHIDLVKPEHADDLVVRILKRFLLS
jgi:hypothetical protein